MMDVFTFWFVFRAYRAQRFQMARVFEQAEIDRQNEAKFKAWWNRTQEERWRPRFEHSVWMAKRFQRLFDLERKEELDRNEAVLLVGAWSTKRWWE